MIEDGEFSLAGGCDGFCAVARGADYDHEIIVVRKTIFVERS